MGFGEALDVGADTAVVEQVDGGLEDSGEQFGRGHFGDTFIEAQGLTYLLRDRDGLSAARVDATTG